MDEQKAEEKRGGVSEFAIVSLVLGILSFVTMVGLEKPIVAIVFGILALRRISRAPQLRGKYLAITGVALSSIAAVLIVVLVFLSWPKIIRMQQLQRAAAQQAQTRQAAGHPSAVK